MGDKPKPKRTGVFRKPGKDVCDQIREAVKDPPLVAEAQRLIEKDKKKSKGEADESS